MDTQELRKAAEKCIPGPSHIFGINARDMADFSSLVTPQTVIQLLDERDARDLYKALIGLCGLMPVTEPELPEVIAAREALAKARGEGRDTNV